MKFSEHKLFILSILGLSFTTLLVSAWNHQQERSKEGSGSVTVSGNALDPSSMQPLPNVVVSWKSLHAKADSKGHYNIELPLGIRELTYSSEGRPSARKFIIIRKPGTPLHLDVLLPDSSLQPRMDMVLDRGSRVGQHGKDLHSDLSTDSTLSLTDQYGNGDHFLRMNTGSFRARSPVWLNGTTIAYGSSGFFHDPDGSKRMGVFEVHTDSTGLAQLASDISAQYVARCPAGDMLAAASQKEVYVMNAIPHGASPHRILSLDPNDGTLLAIDCASNGKIYLTIDYSVPIDGTHYYTRSQIASVKADGSDFKPDWAADPHWSFRYPINGPNGTLIFGRFTLDGQQQKLWSRQLTGDQTLPIADSSLRPVYLDSAAHRLYHIHGGDLHLRDLKSGADWVIVNSVDNGDYLR